MTPLSRREFVLGAGAAGALLATGGLSTAARAATTATARVPAPSASGIEHIVVLCMENRSFDHFLGWVRGAERRQAGLTYLDDAGVAHSTHHLTEFSGCGFNDPDHSHEGGVRQLDGGRMDGFRKGGNDDFALGYFLEPDLPTTSQLVRHFTICDGWFASILGPTYPNRFYTHAATTDRITNTTNMSTLPTIWDRLSAAGVPAAYYFSDIPFLALWGTKYLPIARHITQFYADAALGTLPAYSYLDPAFLGEDQGGSNDDHPHADVRRGQSLVASIVNALMTGPKWSSTLLLVTYDEWGGFFEHVLPLAVPDTPAAVAFAPAMQQPSYAQTGFRVPLFLVSPFAPAGAVRHGRYEHSSILKLVEWRWGLAPLTPRDAAAANPAAMLDFAHRNTTTSIPDVADPGPHICGTENILPSSLTGSQVMGMYDPFWVELRDSPLMRGWS